MAAVMKYVRFEAKRSASIPIGNCDNAPPKLREAIMIPVAEGLKPRLVTTSAKRTTKACPVKWMNECPNANVPRSDAPRRPPIPISCEFVVKSYPHCDRDKLFVGKQQEQL